MHLVARQGSAVGARGKMLRFHEEKGCGHRMKGTKLTEGILSGATCTETTRRRARARAGGGERGGGGTDGLQASHLF